MKYGKITFTRGHITNLVVTIWISLKLNNIYMYTGYKDASKATCISQTVHKYNIKIQNRTFDRRIKE